MAGDGRRRKCAKHRTARRHDREAAGGTTTVEARGLFLALDRETAAALLPRFDTGSWSLYALNGGEATLACESIVDVICDWEFGNVGEGGVGGRDIVSPAL